MYSNILKKDLKRKKTMNVILLLFVILASMFVSSSVNNIVAVSSSLDYYFEQAGMGDYFLATSQQDGKENMEKLLDTTKGVESYKLETYAFIESANITRSNKEVEIPQAVFTKDTERGIKFFDENNNVINSVNKGECYVSAAEVGSGKVDIGDTLTFKVGDKVKKLKVKGAVKDAFLGSSMMGMSRILIDSQDFDYLYKDGKNISGYLGYVNTSDVKELESAINSESKIPIAFSGSKDLIKMTYVLDLVIAFAVLIISVCLILISFAVLRFSINFTLEEEFREIGIMKAIGIGNSKIRGLYIVKYFAISLVGSIIGFGLGIPFGKMLIDSASKTMLMESAGNVLLNGVCSFAVVVIVVLFCYWCTRKIKKFTPIDAVRNGTTGERFKSKSKLSLAKSKLRPVLFMPINDILSSVKRYVVMMLTFVIGFLIIAIITITSSTLTNGSLAGDSGFKESDAYISYDLLNSETGENYNKENVKKQLEEIEKTLADNDMEARCGYDTMFKLSISKGDKSFRSVSFQAVNIDPDEYKYTEGTAPQNENEIAITPMVSEKIGAKLGDKVTISYIDGDKEYIVSAFYQSMSNMGEGIRLHPDADIDYTQSAGSMGISIDFKDNPSQSVIDERIEKIEKLYPDYKVMNGGEYVDQLTGGTGTMIAQMKFLVVPVALIICILVAVLMEKSFITKEKSEIAILKAMGFRTSAIVKLHTIRTAIVMVVSLIIGSLVAKPLTSVSSGQVFKMMGAENITYVSNPLELFVIYPLMMLTATLVAVAITSLYTRKIDPSQISNIE